MTINILTLNDFNMERSGVLMFPFNSELWIKLCRMGRNISASVVLIFGLSAFWASGIIENGCGYLYGYQSVETSFVIIYTISFYWAITGWSYFFCAVVVEPLCCIVLAVQIRQIIKNSKKLQSTGSYNINSSQNIKDIKMNIGQIIIAIYIMICLVPTLSFMLIGFGKVFVLQIIIPLFNYIFKVIVKY